MSRTLTSAAAWTLNDQDNFTLDGYDVRMQTVAESGLIVAWVNAGLLVPRCDANACLIAAAPDLLAALEAIDDAWLNDVPQGPDNPVVVSVWRNLWTGARAAIAQARGEG